MKQFLDIHGEAFSIGEWLAFYDFDAAQYEDDRGFSTHGLRSLWLQGIKNIKKASRVQRLNAVMEGETIGDFIDVHVTANDHDVEPTKLTDLDDSFVPSNIPEEFVATVKPFFAHAHEIFMLWVKAQQAYRSYHFKMPLE